MAGFVTPIERLVQSRLDDSYYTPDTPKLLKKLWHPVFVYGTLRQGFSRHTFLEDCPKVGTGFTRARNFKMFRLKSRLSNTSNFPVVLPTQNPEDQGAVFGEIYLVSTKTLRNLDFIESNGVQYTRYTRVIDVNSKPHKSFMTCWTYIGEPSAWSKTIDSGTLVPVQRTLGAQDFPYYIFKKTDSIATL